MAITKGNVDDRVPVTKLMQGCSGKLFADNGYIDHKLSESLSELRITLITQSKKNMKIRLMPTNLLDVIMHKKRSFIESIFNLLQNKLQLSHTRHRSIANFVVHILAVVTGYQLFGNKPRINMKHLLENLASPEFAFQGSLTKTGDQYIARNSNFRCEGAVSKSPTGFICTNNANSYSGSANSWDNNKNDLPGLFGSWDLTQQ